MGMEKDLARLAGRCGRIINRAAFLQRASLATAVCIAATATVWAIAKVFWPLRHEAALWSLIAIPAAALGAYVWCRRRGDFFTGDEALVVADRLRRNDAELPTRRERPGLLAAPLDESAVQRLPAFNPLPAARSLAPALFYLAIVSLVPPSQPEARHSSLLLAGEIEEMTEYLDENLLEEEVQRELEEKLEELKKDEREISPEQWEALTEIQERVAETFLAAEEEIESIEDILNEMSQAAAMGVSVGDERLTEAGRELMRAVAGVKFFGDKKTLASLQELAEAGMNGTGQGSGKGQGKGKGRGGSGDSSDLKKRLEELKKKLAECKSKCAGGACAGGRPGRGGVNRGRGDANMSYSKDPREIDAAFEMNLIQNEYEDESYDLGLTFIEPEGDVEQDSRGVTVSTRGLEGPGGAIQRTRISPSQKGIVEGYFSGE